MRLLAMVVASVCLVACGGSSAPVQPQYQPQITNTSDSFGFQLTGIQGADGTLSYTWRNTGTSATIDRSSAIAAGSVMLTVQDAAHVQVYQAPLQGSSGSVPTASGTAGDWTIVVDFAGATGTINFRAQKR